MRAIGEFSGQENSLPRATGMSNDHSFHSAPKVKGIFFRRIETLCCPCRSFVRGTNGVNGRSLCRITLSILYASCEKALPSLRPHPRMRCIPDISPIGSPSWWRIAQAGLRHDPRLSLSVWRVFSKFLSAFQSYDLACSFHPTNLLLPLSLDKSSIDPSMMSSQLATTCRI